MCWSRCHPPATALRLSGARNVSAETTRNDNPDEDAVCINAAFDRSIFICEAVDSEISRTLKLAYQRPADCGAVLVVNHGGNFVDIKA